MFQINMGQSRIEKVIKVEQHAENKSPKKAIAWIKKLGIVGFLFFLIKGLIWLAVFFGIANCFGK